MDGDDGGGVDFINKPWLHFTSKKENMAIGGVTSEDDGGVNVPLLSGYL